MYARDNRREAKGERQYAKGQKQVINRQTDNGEHIAGKRLQLKR